MSGCGAPFSTSPRRSLIAVWLSTRASPRRWSPKTFGKSSSIAWAHESGKTMSAAAERQRAAQAEPDRLEGFSSPREVEHVFGHDDAIAEFTDALSSGRMHHAW